MKFIKTLKRKLRASGSEGMSMLDATIALGAVVAVAATIGSTTFQDMISMDKTEDAQVVATVVSEDMKVLVLNAGTGASTFANNVQIGDEMESVKESLTRNNHSMANDLCVYVVRVERTTCPGGTITGQFTASSDDYQGCTPITPPACYTDLFATMSANECKKEAGCLYNSNTGQVVDFVPAGFM